MPQLLVASSWRKLSLLVLLLSISWSETLILPVLLPGVAATTAAAAAATTLLTADILSSALHSSLPFPEVFSTVTAAEASPLLKRAVSLESDTHHVACVARSSPDDFQYECQQDASPQVVVRGGKLLVVSQTWAPPPRAAAVTTTTATATTKAGRGGAEDAVEEATETFATASTGGAVWPSAMALSRYMEEMGGGSSGWWRGKDVVEIGAGIGLNSLTADSLGARSVTLTDGDAGVLRLARQNAADNNLKNVRVENLKFGDRDAVSSLLSASTGKHFDVILGSDLTYKKSDWPTFVETVKMLSRDANADAADEEGGAATKRSAAKPTVFLYATSPRYRGEWEQLQEQFRNAGFRVRDVTLPPRIPGIAIGEDFERYAGGVLQDDIRIMMGEYLGSDSRG